MASKEFLTSINLNQCEIQNAVVQVLAAAPTSPAPVKGQMYVKSSNGRLNVYTGSTWVECIGSGDIPATNLSVTYSASGITISSSTGDDITIGGVSAGNAGAFLPGDKAVLDKAVVNDATDPTAFSFVQASMDTSTSGTPAVDNGKKLATTAAVKAYVDSAVLAAGSVVFQGNYLASTDAPRLDTWTTSTADVAANPIRRGQQWVVSAAGAFFTEAVEVGDLLIANTDKPTTLAEWTRVQKNIGNIADEKLIGYVASTATSATSIDANSTIVDAFEIVHRNAALAQSTADSAQANANGRVPTGRTITVNSGNGITGGSATGADLSANRSWTLGLTGQALAVHSLASNGFFVRTASDTIAARTLTAGTGISITNGDGVAGNPTIAIGTHSHAQSDVTNLETDLAARAKFFRATGPGTAGKTWAITHSLNVASVVAQLWRVSDNKLVDAEFVHTSANVLTVNTDVTMALNAYRVVVIG